MTQTHVQDVDKAAVASSPAPRSIAVVGGGPRCLGLLDRLCANASEQTDTEPRTVVHIFDPFPVGGGRVWRRDQPSLLWMNVPAHAVTVFADDTCDVQGDLRPGPTLATWIEDHRTELSADPDLAAEVAVVTGDSFVSRGLQSAYLEWAYERIVSTAPASLSFVVHRTTVVDLVDDVVEGATVQRILCADDTEYTVDRVVLAQGHLDDELGPREVMYEQFADRHGLVYMPPAYTADCDADRIPGGQPVIVSGLGLAFIDWMVLLGESRGGRFEHDDAGSLSYIASGREPIMYVGSRRGVPYHPKLTHPLLSDPPPLPHFFDVESVVARVGDPRDAHFRTELWPMACKEIAYAHYHELFHSHPDCTTMQWGDFLAEFAESDYGSGRFDRLVAAAVPDEKHRIDIEAIDQPLSTRAAGVDLTDAERMNRFVRQYTADMLDRIDEPRCSVDAAVSLAFFSVYGVFGEMVRRQMLAPSSIVADVDGWLHGLFSHMTSGPPPERLAQLVAMCDAGVVVFMGGGFRASVDDDAGRFTAVSDAHPNPIHADALIDARLPPADINRTVDSLVRSLSARGHISDEIAGTKSGRIRVDEHGRLLHSDGAAHSSRWAVGPWVVGAGWAHAFPRPNQNAGFFRQNDTLARILIDGRSDT
ncbi:FAD/NAD(P)-binding protein [Rhodococcoides kyotonense]|uniref:FAD-NAD(P)-binding n=1 Tax=Rhodococcoides kyotonense TaxID=398843 RepID=A0A239N9F6_9NOCA|nr:FAD/NAD(P)-binding protein [Rhodococcus kyotonensis]SNT50819.1 FAD-NAD(P)-binding [Rhodococcus kyotonensis]